MGRAPPGVAKLDAQRTSGSWVYDLTILAEVPCALSRTRALPLAAEKFFAYPFVVPPARPAENLDRLATKFAVTSDVSSEIIPTHTSAI
jgi:hypothetical protein